VVADTDFPGWTARVNGSPVEILNVNLAFKGVVVPAGEVELSLRYEPRFGVSDAIEAFLKK
jgi:uncharacterized membrane protein YfhO